MLYLCQFLIQAIFLQWLARDRFNKQEWASWRRLLLRDGASRLHMKLKIKLWACVFLCWKQNPHCRLHRHFLHNHRNHHHKHHPNHHHHHASWLREMCRAKILLHHNGTLKWSVLHTCNKFAPQVFTLLEQISTCVEQSELLLPCSLCDTQFRIILEVAIQLLVPMVYDSVNVWRDQTKK